MINNQAYCLAVEQLFGHRGAAPGQVPAHSDRRVAAHASHLIAVGFFVGRLGAFGTPLCTPPQPRAHPGPLRDAGRPRPHHREATCDPGCFCRRPPDFWPALDQFLDDFEGELQEIENLLLNNEILMVRTRGVSPLPRDVAINCSVSGPVLRASGVNWDWRKIAPYDAYDQVEFDVPLGSNGDNYDRFWVRMQEVRQSIRIVRQCIAQIEPGPVRLELPLVLRAQPGAEAYGRVEASKGELGFYLVSDGGVSPYRCKIRSPSLINLTITEHLLLGWKAGLETLDTVSLVSVTQHGRG